MNLKYRKNVRHALRDEFDVIQGEIMGGVVMKEPRIKSNYCIIIKCNCTLSCVNHFQKLLD